jgi:hypothetical protein
MVYELKGGLRDGRIQPEGELRVVLDELGVVLPHAVTRAVYMLNQAAFQVGNNSAYCLDQQGHQDAQGSLFHWVLLVVEGDMPSCSSYTEEIASN